MLGRLNVPNGTHGSRRPNFCWRLLSLPLDCLKWSNFESPSFDQKKAQVYCFHKPYHPGMVYLPTFGWVFMVKVGKYTIHEAYYG